MQKMLHSTAEFSKDRIHRYALWRTWQKSKQIAMFIGLNPSTADEIKNDPTVTRCINYAEHWGYGGMIMANIFAFRATDPTIMKNAADPVGSENNSWLVKLAHNADLIVAAWGNHGEFMERGLEVLRLLKDFQLYCLDMNKTRQPKHPLYCPANLKPTIIE